MRTRKSSVAESGGGINSIVVMTIERATAVAKGKESVAAGGGARSEPRSESVVPAAKRSDGVVVGGERGNVVGWGADEGKVVEELGAG